MISLINYISSKFSKTSSGKFLSFARVVSFLGVMLGVMALLISMAILYGFDNELKKSAVKFTSHITINSYNKEPFSRADEIVTLLKEKFPAIEYAVPIVEREGLVRTKYHTDGVIIKSFDTGNDYNNFAANIKFGEQSFSSDSSKEAIIGKRLAAKLGVNIGESIILYSIKSSENGIPDARINRFELIGLYETGMAQYDDILVLIPPNTAADFFGLSRDDATKIEVMTNDINQTSLLSAQIMEYLSYPFWTMTYYELHSSIFAWIELQKEPIPLVLGLISIVAVLNIITTLLITVVEKTHSIGILRTLGMKRIDIIKIFISQGLKLGLSGMFLGSAFALIFSYLQKHFKFIKLKGEIYFLDALPIHISIEHYILVLAFTFVLVLLSTIIPAIIAASLSPAKAIRFK